MLNILRGAGHDIVFAMHKKMLSLILLAITAFVPAFAQAAGYRDTSMLRAPAGTPVAIYEFEDLECPACAHAFPTVHTAVEKYKIPLIRHDFPLKMHRLALNLPSDKLVS